jgi:ApaG protein
MSMQKTTQPHFQLFVQVKYNETESKPDTQYFFFNYRIRIQNNSDFSAQLMSRYWIINDACGQTEEVRGAGVVGLQPKIPAGQSFEYESACPLPTSSGSLRGTFQMIGEDGSQFDIEIPEFYLIAPFALH